MCNITQKNLMLYNLPECLPFTVTKLDKNILNEQDFISRYFIKHCMSRYILFFKPNIPLMFFLSYIIKVINEIAMEQRKELYAKHQLK